MGYHSFDIFDTLVSRKFATDRGIHAAMRERFREQADYNLPCYFLDDFCSIRIHAQEAAHESSEHQEITLDEIYEAIGRDYPEIGDEVLSQIKSLEDSLEIENCYGIPENIQRVFELLDGGETVILISDMYLCRETITSMLEKADPRLTGLPFYLSSETRTRKFDGVLFGDVCREEKIAPKDLTHTGDNFHIDCLMAERSGLRSVYYEKSHLNSIERSYFRDDGNLFQQVVAGASKQVRLEGFAETPSYHLGGSYTGPLFYGFVHNLLLQAISEGIERVYFLARDGYLLKIIAEEIITELGLAIEIRYLYLSRQSTYFASLFRLNSKSFEWIFQEMDNVITFERVAKRLKIPVSTFSTYLEADLVDALGAHGHDQRLTPVLIAGLQDSLLKKIELKAEIERRAQEDREMVLGYFEQEGLFSGGRIAFVDIGWRGTLQDAVYKIVKSRKPDIAITSHYLAVTHFSSNTFPENRKVPAFMYPSTRPGIGPVLELLLQCEHGTTLGYKVNEEGGYEPILKEPPSHKDGWGVDSYMRGIREFAKKLSGALKENPNLELCYFGISPILIEILENGDSGISEVLGDLDYCGDQEESNLRQFAPPFKSMDALKFLFGSENSRGQFTQWYRGSYVRSGPAARVLLSLDPRINLKRVASGAISREEVLNMKQKLKRFIQLRKTRMRL
ncbi:HAD family hydrolase [Luteolibacter sp. AS25]|uniref:HAD family hydrolase n=1 Tax=Luteolibacter sp. AS25 TaxID=3135776 RepID=UPI00398BB3AA